MVVISVIAFMSIFWLFSIAKYEQNTYLYGGKIVGKYEQTNRIDGNKKPKVLKYSDKFVTIYYKDVECGNLITFKKGSNN